MSASVKGRISYHLSKRHFMLALAIAAALHMAAFVAYWLMPRDAVIDVPVRVLNLKLGSGDALEAISAEEITEDEPLSPNREPVEDSLAQSFASAPPYSADRGLNPLERDIAEKAARLLRRENGKNATPMTQAAQAAQQYVRERVAAPPPSAQPGHALGNSVASQAEILSRYEQAISLWVQRFKIYPEAARAARLSGEAIIRVRIDRRGTIRYSSLEVTTGHEVLDRAAIEMIRRANPVPPVPDNYPAGELIEFLIPVSFQLQ